MCVCKSPGLRPAYLDLVLALGLGVGRDPVELFNLTLMCVDIQYSQYSLQQAPSPNIVNIDALRCQNCVTLEPVDSPDLGEHGAVAQREAEVEQPLGRRAGRGEQVVRNLRQYDIDMQISYLMRIEECYRVIQ